MVSGFVPHFGIGRATGVAGSVSGGGFAKQVVRSMAAKMGWTGAQWAALDRLVASESSWNPNAKNPTSSARGLFQKMTSIHGPIEGSVAGQARWGLNYIKKRYGSPANAWGFHVRHGYYDTGGILPSGRMAINRSGRPERVLDPRTTANFERLTASIDVAARRGVGARTSAASGGRERFDLYLDRGSRERLTGYVRRVAQATNAGERRYGQTLQDRSR